MEGGFDGKVDQSREMLEPMEGEGDADGQRQKGRRPRHTGMLTC